MDRNLASRPSISAFIALLFILDGTSSSALGAESKQLYSGIFEWKGASLRFDIEALSKPQEGKSRFVAYIKNQAGETQAACEKELTGQAPFDAHSMNLLCLGTLFAPTQALAKFSFQDTLPRPTLSFLNIGKATTTLELRPL